MKYLGVAQQAAVIFPIAGSLKGYRAPSLPSLHRRSIDPSAQVLTGSRADSKVDPVVCWYKRTSTMNANTSAQESDCDDRVDAPQQQQHEQEQQVLSKPHIPPPSTLARSDVLNRLAAFLPQMAAANAQLAAIGTSPLASIVDIQEVEDGGDGEAQSRASMMAGEDEQTMLADGMGEDMSPVHALITAMLGVDASRATTAKTTTAATTQARSAAHRREPIVDVEAVSDDDEFAPVDIEHTDSEDEDSDARVENNEDATSFTTSTTLADTVMLEGRIDMPPPTMQIEMDIGVGVFDVAPGYDASTALHLPNVTVVDHERKSVSELEYAVAEGDSSVPRTATALRKSKLIEEMP